MVYKTYMFHGFNTQGTTLVRKGVFMSCFGTINVNLPGIFKKEGIRSLTVVVLRIPDEDPVIRLKSDCIVVRT